MAEMFSAHFTASTFLDHIRYSRYRIRTDSLGLATQLKCWKSDIRSSAFNKNFIQVSSVFSIGAQIGETIQKIKYQITGWFFRRGKTRLHREKRLGVEMI